MCPRFAMTNALVKLKIYKKNQANLIGWTGGHRMLQVSPLRALGMAYYSL